MVHIGNTPASNFASVTKDTFSGDGSTTAFTLSKAATTNGVAVFVENVRQEPTTAYAVSGTTLTFTAAPVSASGNNIYVLHHNTPASTVTHPAGQDLTAANATLTGDVTIGSGTAADRKIVFDGNAQDYHVGLDDSVDKLIIGKGSALGTTSHIVTDANGAVTMPLQPRLSVYQYSAQTISHNTYTKLKLDGTDSITNGFTGWTQSNTHTRWTTATAGTYRIHASMRWYTNSAISTSLLDIYKNGSRITFGYDHTLDNYAQLHAMTIHDLSASDYLEVIVYQYSGGDVAMNGGSANLVRLTADLIA
tara:strand:+ start:941 stop:1858 length:918 start_codon:yes stop_codon:yes gene_type:complete